MPRVAASAVIARTIAWSAGCESMLRRNERSIFSLSIGSWRRYARLE
jgi:hypothetical protein